MSIHLHRYLTLPAVAIAATALAGCSGTPVEQTSTSAKKEANLPLTIDSCGRAVTFTESPQRVLTAGSVAAPIIAAAGAGDRIVTRSYEASPFPGEYAPDLERAELVSPKAELGREDVLARTPDLVVTFASTTVSAADLEAAGVAQLVTRGYCKDAKGSFDDIFADIELYGELFGTADSARREVSELRDRVTAVTEASADLPQRRAATLILSADGSTLKAYGSASTSHHQMTALGLDNVFGDRSERLIEINAEELIARNPEVIVLLLQGEQTPADTSAALRSRTGLSVVDAIRADRIVAIPFGYSGPSPVAVEGTEVLQKELAAMNR